MAYGLITEAECKSPYLWKLIDTDFSFDFYEKIKSNKDFLKKILSTEKYD